MRVPGDLLNRGYRWLCWGRLRYVYAAYFREKGRWIPALLLAGFRDWDSETGVSGFVAEPERLHPDYESRIGIGTAD